MVSKKNTSQSEINKELLKASMESDFDRAMDLIKQGADATQGISGKYVLNELFFEAKLELLEAVFATINNKLKARKGLFDNVITYWRPADDQLRIIELMLDKGAAIDPDDTALSVINSLKEYPSATDNTLKKTQEIAEGPLKRLLELGMNPNYIEPNGNKETMLFLSVYAHSPALVKTLIEYGADPNLMTGKGYTPLMVACGSVYRDGQVWINSKSKEQIAHYLLQHGADPSIKTNSRRTALSYAKLSDNRIMTELLENFEKKGVLPDEVPEFDEYRRIIEIEAFEEETNRLVRGKDCSKSWPIEDKSWFKKRQDIWKYIQENLIPLTHSNIKRKVLPELKRYFMYGTPLPVNNYYLEFLFKIWFHPSDDYELLKKIAYDTKNGFSNTRNELFCNVQWRDFKLPYGMLGPRAPIIARIIAETVYPITDNPLQEATASGAASFMTSFCEQIPIFIGKKQNDPYMFFQYLVDYALECVDYIYKTDELKILKVNCSRMLSGLSEYDVNNVPLYKRAKTEVLVKRLKLELTKGFYNRLTYRGITDINNKEMVVGMVSTDDLYPIWIGKMYVFQIIRGELNGELPVRVIRADRHHGESYVATILPHQYKLEKISEDKCLIGFKSVFPTQTDKYIIEFLHTDNQKLTLNGIQEQQQRWENIISEKLLSIQKIREKICYEIKIELEQANYYFYCNNNYKKAYAIYAKYAARGYTEAVYGVAQCYEQGYEVEKNKDKAEQLYHECAVKGIVDAQERLAFLLARKSDVSYHQPLKWIFLADMNKYDRLGGSEYDLDAFIEQHQNVINWLVESAKEGDMNSKYYLGRILIKKRNKEEGMELIEESAELGCSSAIYYMLCKTKRTFFEGDLSKLENEAILEKYYKLAETGHKYALYDLGDYLYCRNDKSAIDFFVASAIRGVKASMSRLVRCYLKEGASDQDIMQGMMWLIICFYLDYSTYSLEKVCENYECLLTGDQQQQVIRLADEYMDQYIIKYSIKESNWVFKVYDGEGKILGDIHR
jgi:TPR repeat protein/ankyrin repeat protein